jgi:hypothetical protein
MTISENTVKALVDITMTFFPEHRIAGRPERVAGLQNVIGKFLTGAFPYDVASRLVSELAGVCQPLDRMKAILETRDDPIPTAKELLEPRSGLRHKTRAWSAYEDRRLLCGMYKHGIENWTAIAKFVGNGRTRGQCSQRWYRGLDPTISKQPWSTEEKDRLLNLVDQFGDRSWTAIASRMGNRSDVQCRYKYKHLQEERARCGAIVPPVFAPQVQRTDLHSERPVVRRTCRRTQPSPAAHPPDRIEIPFGDAHGTAEGQRSLYGATLPPLMIRSGMTMPAPQ